MDELKEMIQLIINTDLRNKTLEALPPDEHPFWRMPASSSGKYHPAKACEVGGLVWHTKRVVTIAMHLCDLYGVWDSERDSVMVACILHDIDKPLLEHAHVTAGRLEYLGFSPTIVHAVRHHMSRWSIKGSNTSNHWQDNKESRFVAEADYIASRKDLC